MSVHGSENFNSQLLPAEAIREIRARGCTTPGIAETIVEHHGAEAVLENLHRVEELGNECASSDTETGAKMRALLHNAAGQTGKAASDSVMDTSSKPAEVQSPADSGAAPAESSADAGAASDPAPAGNSSEPSAADLDAVAKEQEAKSATAAAAPSLGDA